MEIALLRPWAAWLVASSVVMLVGCVEVDPDHCAYQQGLRGHAWCAAQDPMFPLCSQCERSDNGHFGCTDERDAPARCLVGRPEPGDGTDTAGPAMDATADSTGVTESCEHDGIDPACREVDPTRSFCSGGECVVCRDELCAGLEQGTPWCAPGGKACVACRAEPGSAGSDCPSEAPYCGASLACSASCSAHEHCDEHQACDLTTGQCIAQVLWVNANAAHCPGPTTPDPSNGSLLYPFCSFARAVAMVPPGMPVILKLRNLGLHPEPEPVTITEGQSIVIAATSDARRPGDTEIQATHPDVMITVDAGANLALRGVVLSRQAATEAGGLACEGGRLWLDDMEVRGHGPGVIVRACDLLVQRSKIHSNAHDGFWTPPLQGRPDTSIVRIEASAITNNGADGIEFAGDSLTIAYATIVDNANQNVRCADDTAGGTVSIRNSIVLGPLAGDPSDPEPAIDCSASVHAAGHNVTNADLGLDIGGAFMDWFQAHQVGDVRIKEGSSTPFEAVGRWELGDPIHDIEGKLRPVLEVSGEVVTFAGAHEP
jgi:hypothetical protein